MFSTDSGTLIVRGYAITDEQALSDLGEVPAGEVDIEIPAELLRFYESPMKDDPRYIADHKDAEEGR